MVGRNPSMDREGRMFKRNIVFFLAVFIFLTVKQFIFNDHIRWVDNTGLSLIVFLVYAFQDWTKKQNKPNQHNDA